MFMQQVGDWHGKMLGRYQLIRLLGRGGMGEVWLGEDTQLRRQIAVKLLPAVLATEQSYLRDFEREARAAATLEHPHILPVHDFGEQATETGIITYIIMPYLTGGSLRDRLRTAHGPLPAHEAVHYLRQAALAIDYAHSQNVLHRDIKPANMLLQGDWLLLSDFGIAKLLTGSTRKSQTHSGAGTPEYMAPEQAQGNAEFASDRYSLAMVAYQLFTGQLPFKGETPYSILLKQVQEEPPDPRAFNPALPVTITQVILTGLAKRPADRPATCVALVDALEHASQGGGAAQTDPEATVLAPWSKRRKQLIRPGLQKIMLSGIPAIPQASPDLPVTPPASYYPTHTPAYQQAAVQVPATYYAPDAPTSFPDTTYPSVPPLPPQQEPHLKVSRRAFLAAGASAAVVAAGGAALSSYLHFSHRSAPPPILTRGPQKLIPGVPLLSLAGHSKPLWNAVWDPTGRYLATAGEDTYVMLWDIARYLQQGASKMQTINAPLRRWKFSDTIYDNALCWSADGRTLAVAISGDNNKLYLVDAFKNGSVPQTYQDSALVNSGNILSYAHIAWAPHSKTFATSALTQRQIQLWQAGNTTGPLSTFRATGITDTRIDIDEIAWSPDGALVAGITNSNPIVVWDAKTGAVKQLLEMPDRPHAPNIVLRWALAWSPLDPHLLVGSDSDVATLWDVQRNKLLLMLKTNDRVPYVTGLTWSSNGKYVAGSYARSPRVYVWDIQSTAGEATGALRTPKLFFPQHGQPGHTKTVIDVAWSPDGHYIASASADSTVIVWKVDAF